MSLSMQDLPRDAPREGGRYEFGPFRLDPAERLLTREGQPAALTPKAFDLLVYLVERAGRLVEKRELMAALWPDAVVEEANLAYTVSALRKALGDGQEGEQFIQTVPTRGYRFVAAVRQQRPDDSSPTPRLRGLIAAGTGVAFLVGGLVAWHRSRSDGAAGQVVRFEVATIAPRDVMTPAISPDGTRVVYAMTQGAQRQLYLRRLDSLQATPLPGTANAFQPFFSPDGHAIGFFVGVAGSDVNPILMTLDLAGSRLTTVCATGGAGDGPLGATWGTDGWIYYGANYAGLRAVPAVGGKPVTLTTPRPGEGVHGWPQALPGGRLLFSMWPSDDVAHTKVEVLSLSSRERRTILEGVAGARYLSSGHITYREKGALFAVRFDLRTLRVSGTPTRVLEAVAGGDDDQPYYAASESGALVYHPGSTLVQWTQMSWIANGTEQQIAAPPGLYTDPSLSRDDRRLLVAPVYADYQEIWMHDFARGTWARLTTPGGSATAPLWHPADPARIVFTSARPGQPGLDLLSMPVDGSAPPELLWASGYPKYATTSAPAAGLVAFVEIRPDTKADVWLLDLRGKPAARPLMQTPYWEGCPALSPDGRWVAYTSNESGRSQVYVRPVSGDPGKWMISTDGGYKARWSRDGGRIVYWTRAGIMSVDVEDHPSFEAGTPKILVEGSFDAHGVTPNDELSGDGRLLVIRKVKDQPGFPLVVVQNWFAEIEQGVRQ
jgi:DNA-binding winged helix-turn-helix (wHTH) protein/Tol biopolymer transport system component